MYEPPELPQRFEVKPKLHYGRQDSTNFEARASVDHLSREYGQSRSGGEYGETRCGNIDFRIEGLPHSTVQQLDDTRRESVKKLSHQFETHPNREAWKAWKGLSVQPTQRDVKGHDPQHGKHEVLRDHFQSRAPELFNILDDGHLCTVLAEHA